METYFDETGASLIAICLSAFGVYIAVIIFTRIAGKRSFTKMSSFDFAMTVSIGAIMATTILSPHVSLLQGVVGMAAIFILELVSNFLRQFNFYRKMVDNRPLLLMEGPVILKENLKKVRLTEEDLRASLRRQNVLRLSQVRAVVFENTGDISILRTENDDEELQEWFLRNVKR